MKIAFLVNQFPLLSETFILNQITGLIDRGNKVYIFAGKPLNSSKMHEDIKKYNLLDCTYYHKSMMPGNKILRAINGIGLIIRYMLQNPLPIFNSLNFFKFGRKAVSLELLFLIIPLLEYGPFDIVHAHFGTQGNVAVFFKELYVINCKIVTTFHGFDMTRYIKDEGDSVYNRLFTKGDLCLPISECWKNKLIELGCCKDKIVVHRMGVDVDKFNFSPRKQKSDKKIKLLTVARLVEKKGVEYGIRAVSKLMHKHLNVEYGIIGDGPLKKNLESLIEELRMGGSIKLLGWKQQDEIIGSLKGADILLVPSVTSQNGDQEGIPVVIMEALAQGLLVISTLHSGIPELVEDGVSGFLVPERDVHSLADRLAYLIDHPEIWSEMGRHGREIVTKEYNINKLNDQLVELYRRILSGARL